MISRDMKIPESIPDETQFECNICGSRNTWTPRKSHREIPSCRKCNSVARFRGLMLALSERLFGERMSIHNFPRNKGIRGIGMSDAPAIARMLSKKFDFVNTQFHTEPRLDLTSAGPLPYSQLDFVICSEVFEHIQRPLDIAFRNLFRLLRPGGTLIFSAPYFDTPETIEHYPDLHEYEIVNFRGKALVVNRTAAGAWQVFDNPVFHGGEGTTLEMRLFSENALLDGLRGAGFSDIKVYDEPDFRFGYYWPPLTHWKLEFANPAYVISAVR